MINYINNADTIKKINSNKTKKQEPLAGVFEGRKGGVVIRVADLPEILIRHLNLRRVAINLRNSSRRRSSRRRIGNEIRVRVLREIRNEERIGARVRVDQGNLLRLWL